MNDQDMLKFVESIANSTSGNLHGFNGRMVQEARKLVRDAGGTLKKVGRYEADSCACKPHEIYRNGDWHHAKLDPETDIWSFPTLGLEV